MISNLSNLISRRDLLRELVLSELRASTAETRLGWMWWLIDPILQMLIYWAVVVGILGRGRPEYAPYPVFVLCAIMTWKHFSKSATIATKILLTKEPLIKAVPFPTMILPLSQAMSTLVFFLFGLVVVFAASVAFGGENHTGEYAPLVQVAPLIVLQLAVVIGLTLPLCCWGVLYRDLNSFIEHVLRIGFLLSPSLFGLDLIREWISKLGPAAAERSWLPANLPDIVFGIYMLNPFAILITGYRDAIFYGRWLEGGYWLILVVEAVVFLYFGYRIFQHYDRRVIKFL
jgi:ABC-type polysaccharide/polyol phosphate export permease